MVNVAFHVSRFLTCSPDTHVLVLCVTAIYIVHTQALGIAVLGIGIWAVVRENDFAFLTGNDIASGGAILIAAGVVTLIVCVIGILGGIFKNRPLLVIVSEFLVNFCDASSLGLCTTLWFVLVSKRERQMLLNSKCLDKLDVHIECGYLLCSK